MQAKSIAPAGVDPHEWNAYIRSAQSFAEVSDRIEAAIAARVEFAYMGALDIAQYDRPVWIER